MSEPFKFIAKIPMDEPFKRGHAEPSLSGRSKLVVLIGKYFILLFSHLRLQPQHRTVSEYFGRSDNCFGFEMISIFNSVFQSGKSGPRIARNIFWRHWQSNGNLGIHFLQLNETLAPQRICKTGLKHFSKPLSFGDFWLWL